jgi:hypothetical protein
LYRRSEKKARATIFGVPGAQGTLDERVSDWLRSMAASWSDALPPERDVTGPFIMDVVPAVSGSSIRQVA